MRNVFKRIATPILVPLTRWYLRKERGYTRGDITVRVHPGVFHPGLFSSTNFLAEYFDGVPLEHKTFLELGCGTGFLSIAAARRGAEVTASDLSAAAVENTRLNATRNGVSIRVIQTDLLTDIPHGTFDIVAINPPYYARTPGNESELAWHCGEDFEYFRKLFTQLDGYMNEDSLTVMVLTMGCDIAAISSIAEENGFRFVLLKEKRVPFDEKDFLYRIRYESLRSTLGSKHAHS